MPSTTTRLIDGLSASVAVKAPCVAVATSNITLSGLQTIGTVTVVEDDRVLVTGQTDAEDNGIYVATTGQWQRAQDFDGNRDAVQGTRVLVRSTGSDGIEYELVTANPITIGTTELTFELRYGANATYDQTAAESAAGVVPADTSLPPAPVADSYRYLSATESADVSGYLAAINVTTKLTNAMEVAWEDQNEFLLRSGSYLAINLEMPGASARRERSFILRGQGMGEIFDRTQTGGTIIKGTGANSPIFKYTPDVANTGNGSADISQLRFEGDSSSAYVVDFGSFYAQSYFHDSAIWQAGAGGGLRIQMANTAMFDRLYVVNDDFLTSGLGLSRTGIGVTFTNTIDTGLTTFSKITSRGFLTAYSIGGGAGTHYSNKLLDFECSVTRNGVLLASNVTAMVTWGGYMEGGDGGIGYQDLGQFNKLYDTLIFPGYGVCADLSNVSGYGSLALGNVFSAGSIASTIQSKFGSSGSGGGPGKAIVYNAYAFSGSGGTTFTASITGTTMTVSAFGAGTALAVGMSVNAANARNGSYITALGTGTGGTGTYTLNLAQEVSSRAFIAGSIAGVIGMQHSGIDPFGDTWPNFFDPRGPYIGTSTTKKYDDQSTSGDGTTGSGLIGMHHAQSIDGRFTGPRLGRGALNIKVDDTIIDNNYLSGGVLTLGELSVFKVDFSSTGDVSSFSSPNLPDKTFDLICLSSTAQPRFVHSSTGLLRTYNGANYTPPTAGAYLQFQIVAPGIAYMKAPPCPYST